MLLSLGAIAVSAQLRSWPNRRLDEDTSDALAEIEAAAMQESPKALPPSIRSCRLRLAKNRRQKKIPTKGCNSQRACYNLLNVNSNAEAH